MRTVERTDALKAVLRAWRERSVTVGFVPTMGYLHEGHLSLVRRSQAENDRTVVSIYVNPLQFGPREDLDTYPRNLARDRALLIRQGADLLYLPRTIDLYPSGHTTRVSVPALTGVLCGPFRPGHFEGVATIVLKLLNLVAPRTVYLGLKDYQQYRVIERMVRDLDVPVRVRGCPTVRETDGLALSSRNARLSRAERVQAPALRRALLRGRQLIAGGERSAGRLRTQMARLFRRVAPAARVDYFDVVGALDLERVVRLSPEAAVCLAGAVRLGSTRLIDNEIVAAVNGRRRTRKD